VLIGDDGAKLSMPGQLPAACYKTKVPTTVLGALIRHGVYPEPYVEQLDGIYGNLGPNGGDDAIARNVTQVCTIGWDWVPAARDRNMGLWQNVWLEATGPVAVRDPAAFTDVRLPGGDEASVTLRLHLHNAADTEQKVELTARIKPEGFSGDTIEVRNNVVLAASSLKEIILKPDVHPDLVMKKPKLWWPVTYGDQPLYRLSVEARVDGRVGDDSVHTITIP
jgi:hypothetical protein